LFASFYYNAWGDVTTSIMYNTWTLEPNGMRYPREWDVQPRGLPDRNQMIVDLRFNAPSITAPSRFPRQSLRQNPHGATPVDQLPLGWAGDGKPIVSAPHVVQFPGGWNGGVRRPAGRRRAH
jgi:hypothetical protein